MQTTVLDQYIEFSIEQEQYAIRIEDIQEIIKMQDIKQMPNVLRYVKGVINLRGKIVPVISLRAFFSMQEKEYTNATRIVVVNHQEEAVGIIVDSVNKVTRFSDIQAPPDKVSGNDGTYFVGIGLTEHDIVGILKLDTVLVHE